MSTDQRPAETANRQHREDALAETVSQLAAARSEHTKAMAAPLDVPPVPDAHSKHIGGDDAGYPA